MLFALNVYFAFWLLVGLALAVRVRHPVAILHASAWGVISLINFVLILVGFPVVALHIVRKHVEVRESQRYPDGRLVLSFYSRWAWLWGNEEDGIDGIPVLASGDEDPRQSWWHDLTRDWTIQKRIWVWSAWRNSVSNLRFVPGLSVKVDPLAIHSRTLKRVPNISCWYVWQDAYARLHWETPTRVFEIGWKLTPGDKFGIDARDTRLPGIGFGVRWKRR